MRVGTSEWREFREEWAVALTLLGGYGYRPKLVPEGLIGYRADGSTVTVRGTDQTLGPQRYDAALRIELRGSDGDVRAADVVVFDGDDELVRAVLVLLERCAEENASDRPFIRHFPPNTELERMELTAAYCAYAPYLDALASQGVHAYLEQNAFSLRIYSDISPQLLLDISIDDEGLPVLGPRDGGWVVFLTAPDGHEAEFTVDRFEDRDEDAEVLAEAVVAGLKEILGGGHIYFEDYDLLLGRLDPPWMTSGDE